MTNVRCIKVKDHEVLTDRKDIMSFKKYYTRRVGRNFIIFIKRGGYPGVTDGCHGD